jgi:hypothetical protein
MKLKAVPIRLVNGKQEQCEPNEASYLKFILPSDGGIQMLPVILKGSRDNSNAWTWNGDVYNPTLKPSVLVQGFVPGTRQPLRCHTWITDGKAQFLGDCSHDLVNTTVDLKDVEF